MIAGRKAALALALLLSVPGFASGQQNPQTSTLADAGPGDPPPLPVGRNEYVQMNVLADERVLEYVIGPVDLAVGMDHLRLPIQMAEFPVDGWLHGFELDMVDGAGNPIPMDLLHHVNFIDPDKRELFSSIARRVMAAGRETETQRVPRFLGYPIADGDRLLIATMFANPLEEDYPDANLRVRFFYSTEADGFMQPRNFFPFYLDVVGPLGEKDFPVPPGKSTKSWEGSPAVTGRILVIGGHVHDYATRIALIDVTADRVVWEVEPEALPNGHVTGVPSDKFLWTLGKKIEDDHVYRVEVEYDNPLDVPAPDGGMGAIGGVVWVGKGVAWPPFDRTDEMYVDDLTGTLTAPERMKGHGHGGMNATGDMQGMPADTRARGAEDTEAAERPDAPADHEHAGQGH